MPWITQVDAPIESFCRVWSQARGEYVDVRELGAFALGRALSGHALMEYQLKLNDAWVSAGDVEVGRQLLSAGSIEFRNKGLVDLCPPVQWATVAGEDNYGWQLHSLEFLKHLVRLHAETGDAAAIDLAKAIIRDWAGANLRVPPPSRLSWNDHSTALRLAVLGHVFTYFLRNDIEDVDFLRFLMALAARHQSVLLEETFYSKGTNHGLDQAFQLYLSSFAFPEFSASRSAREVSLARVKYEVEHSFARDGVHVENSPSYHPVILSSVLQINGTISRLGGEAVIEDVEQFIPKALRFLAYVLRPDGCFPPIGDSEITPIRNNLAWLAGYPGWEACEFAMSGGERGRDSEPWHAVFPDSGWVVFRGDPEVFVPARRPHVVFKCGLLSRYHRHDDDTAFVLHALGEDWLVDGGLFIHDHGIAEREYVRSALAHNLLMPAGAKAERLPGDGRISELLDVDLDASAASATARTRMFPGFVIQRRLGYDGGLELSLEDRAEADDQEVHLYQQFWQVPGEHAVEITDDGFLARSPRTGNSMHVRIQSGNLVWHGQATPVTGSLGVYSRQYGRLEPVTVIRADLLGAGALEVRADIRIESGTEA